MNMMLQLMNADRWNTEKIVRILDATVNRGNRTEGHNATHRFKPDKYHGSADASIDSWLTMMRIHLEQQDEMEENEKPSW